ncbi:MAG: LacI family DNA-binding transcriptional regulator [Rhodobacter sp.]|nr:LacI family DNA-binding transcriptional regulator [Paracoccaceae bacterium]MCC0080518.1 LacI family DNA-binding transcriptional regulator [Rhodobacter sp.]
MVTIKDIGRAIGVSHATVSRALNGSPLVKPDTRALVLETARSMGYRPDSAARMLRGSTANIIGFVLPDITNAFYSRIASVVGRYSSDHGLQLVLATTDDDPMREEHHIIELQHARARAIIVTPTEGMTPTSIAALNEMQTLQLVRRHPGLDADLIAADDRQGVATATRHLLDNGHRRIAYIGGGGETLSTGQERLDGYLTTMAQAGLSDHVRFELGPPQPEFGRAAMLRLLQDAPPPQAVVLGSSQLTIGFLEAVVASGLSIPAQLSFTGYDDPGWFAFWGPGITSVQLPIDKIARTIAAIAAGRTIDTPDAQITTGDTGVQTIRFPCTLARRGTVARA